MFSLAFLIQSTAVEAAPLSASPCTLAWNLNPEPTVSGYCLYFGITGSTTTNRLDVGRTNMVTLKSLVASSNYFFYVVAYNTNGIESPPSALMCYTPRALSGLKLTPLANRTLSLHFLATTGAVCHVEYTPTLNPPRWQTLSNAIADANGNVTLTDPLTGNPPTRFYRTALP
jgi:hypothetical protein